MRTSLTLALIMKHWKGPLPEGDYSVKLPFDIEAFCREMDEKLEDLALYEAMVKEAK